jgi:hypothetical protein
LEIDDAVKTKLEEDAVLNGSVDRRELKQFHARKRVSADLDKEGSIRRAVGRLDRRIPRSNIREEFAERHESEVNPLRVRYKDEPWTEDEKLSDSETVAGRESGNNEADCAAIRRRSTSAAPRKAQTGGNRIQQKPAERFARVGETCDEARSHRQKVVLKVGDRERSGVYAPEEDVENAENNQLLAETDVEGEQDALVDMMEVQDNCDGEELGPMGILRVNVTSERYSRWGCQ